MKTYPRLHLLLLFLLLPLALVGCGGGGNALTGGTTTGTGTSTSSVTAVAETAPAAAQINWTATSLGSAQSFVSYNVYRDGSAIATLSQATTSFLDSTATAAHTLTYAAVPAGVAAQTTSETVNVASVLTGVAHTYTVTVVYSDASVPGETAYHEVSLGTSAAVTLLIGTTIVTAVQATTTTVAVTWTEPSLTTSQSLIAYNIYRDNAIIASAAGGMLTFTDSTATASHSLTYTVVIAGSASALSSQTATIPAVTTGVAHTYVVTAVYLDASASPGTYHEVSLGTSAAVTLPAS